MLIRHLSEPVPRDLRVEIDDPDATVADLAEALAPGRPIGPLVIDGRQVPAATPLDRAAITDGAIVSRPPDPSGDGSDLDPRDPWTAPLRLVVTAGSDAGRAVAVAPGTWILGRAADGDDRDGGDGGDEGGGDRDGHVVLHDPTVSIRHLRLTVRDDGSARAEDLGSTNGTWIEDAALLEPSEVRPGQEVRCGAARVSIRRHHDHPGGSPPRLPGAGTRPWHRPPRPVPEAEPPRIDLPVEPTAGGPVTPVGMVAVVASVAVGGVMVLVLHSWTYALFALLGPVLVIANSVDGRRRRRRTERRGRRRRRHDLAALGAELGVRRDQERASLHLDHPGAAGAMATVAAPRTTLWERRSGDPDAFVVRIGIGAVPWAPPLAADRASWPGDVSALVDDVGPMADAPVVLRLDPLAPIAVVGSHEIARRVVRSILVQACAAHGPADLQVAVLCSDAVAHRWHWCAWLPHAHDPAVGSLLAATADAAAVVAGARDDEAPTRRVVVIDHPEALADRRGPARALLRSAGEPDAELVPIVLVPDAADVPAACRVVVTVRDDATLAVPAAMAHGPVALDGTHPDVAADLARRLAGLDDPEVDDPGRGLPERVALSSLLGVERATPAGLAARWRAAGADPPPRAVLGLGVDGPVVVDLAVDGPHALVAGTTGAGKSELLRTMVASLAATCSPDHLTFVLIDFKGGSAFDACARLPHTTGLVTDLDDHLAARALRCLEAELRHRERRLREAGTSDLGELRRADPGGDPLPRLVVVVDEFATLAAELPDFVDALVGVAQRGRSLGVHLVLATQRPSGSVSEHIRANTALRIALRVHSANDSADVIDSPAAAGLPRLRPGRALVRFGPGELVPIQTALATAPRRVGPTEPVSVHPLRIPTGGPSPRRPRSAVDLGPEGRATELDALVDHAVHAWVAEGGRPPRRPWPDPLPLEVAWPIVDPASGADLPETAGEPDLVLGLADDPEHQRHTTFAWRPAEGPLLVVGLPGSGTTTVVATAALAAARRWSPHECHIHVIDMGAGDLLPLAGLAHVGAVIGADETERQRRLCRELADELARRRATDATPGGAPRRVLLVDGLGALRSRWGDLDPSGTWDRFVDIATRGPEVGIHVLVAAEGTAAAPHQVVSACHQRLVLRLGERGDHGAFGIPASAVPVLPPGRGVASAGAALVQVARPPDGLASAVARLAGVAADVTPEAAPRSVQVLPTLLAWSDLDAPMGAGCDGAGAPVPGELALLIGLSDEGLSPARLLLPPAGHAVVAGPPRSGRTTALATLAVAARTQGSRVVVVSRRVGPWADLGFEAIDPHRVDHGDVDGDGPLLVVVDDADLTDDEHPVLGRAARERRADRHVVAAARNDRLRAGYAHWTRELRADRLGLLLVPDPDLDGDLLGVRLPRRPGTALVPGRGWMAGGEPEGFAQVAVAAPTAPH